MHLHVNTDNPNQSRDVIVQFTERCETRNNCTTVWTVWLGAAEQREFSDQYEALRFARALADEHRVPVWKMGREWEGLVRLGN